MNLHELYFFSGFILFVVLMLFIDLGVFNKHIHIVKTREALIWTCVWVFISLAFFFFLKHFGHLIHGDSSVGNILELSKKYGHVFQTTGLDAEGIIHAYNHSLALEYISGYIIELSLSVDNIFVMVLIFAAFKVPKKYYHKVLFLGIAGAVIFRFIFIFTGAFLVSRFEWIFYVFAVFLIYTGIKMFFSRNKEDVPEVDKHPIIRFASRYFNVLPSFREGSFFVREHGKLFITPLFLVVVIIEFSDVVFAVDSIPAIFAVTKDPYIIFFSNIFAILGLRSIFFLVFNMLDRFRFFKAGLSFILVFIGLKMLFEDYFEKMGFTTAHSLYVILIILVLSLISSFVLKPPPAKKD
jgi:tellurite resistance protein TerC